MRPKKTRVLSVKAIWKLVIEYKTELRELANFEEYLCSKFEEGLTLEIKERMSVSGS